MKRGLKHRSVDYVSIIALCAVTVTLLSIVLWLSGSSALVAQVPEASSPDVKQATFAGGCFWCMVAPFENLPGVASVTSGYTGGTVEQPSYKQVVSGETGHVEAVQILYNPSLIRYEDILAVFWRNIDPTDAGGQFVDRGQAYQTAIFYHDAEQKAIAENSKKDLTESGRYAMEIVTPIREAKPFYPAEAYHQNYHKTNRIRYKMYRNHSGRDDFLERVWGADREYPLPKRAQVDAAYKKPSKTELRQRLSDLQYQVTQHADTEPAFNNRYWDHTEPGIYVDVVSGEALFSSKDKFRSDTGWPSFTKPLVPQSLVMRRDFKLLIPRTEVRSKYAGSHLGHVFDDGPDPGGRRYCINSAALRFIPADRLAEEGYPEYAAAFHE